MSANIELAYSSILGSLSDFISVAGVIQLSSTWHLVLGMVGKGSPSSPEKKVKLKCSGEENL